MAQKWCEHCKHLMRKHFRMSSGMIRCTSTVREYENNYKDITESPCMCQFAPSPRRKQKKKVVQERCKAMLKGKPAMRCAHAVLWGEYCHVHYKAIPKNVEGMLT